jgi:tRNA (cytosine34-C5)-methyltransferase
VISIDEKGEPMGGGKPRSHKRRAPPADVEAVPDEPDTPAYLSPGESEAGAAFAAYYRKQRILPSPAENDDEDAWRAFFAQLRRPLPVTFRVNESAHLRVLVREAMEAGAHLLDPRAAGVEPPCDETGRPLRLPVRLGWSGGWQLGCSAGVLKRPQHAYWSELNEWLTRWSALGVISRQAVDSMAPVSLLGIEPHHAVLDLCASPGSKTQQALDAIHAGVHRGPSDAGDGAREGQRGAELARGRRGRLRAPGAEPPSKGHSHDHDHGSNDPATSSTPRPPTGFVIANDFSPVRARMLVRRCAALGQAAARVAVTSHSAQHFPDLSVSASAGASASTSAGVSANASASAIAPVGGDGEGVRAPGPGAGGGTLPGAGLYDRIICDVPCCGDGTFRKNPEAWNHWRPSFAQRLHGLQIAIALRGLALLKVGGEMAYSTCAFNPIEDEAVVAELLRRTDGAVELVDVSARQPALRRRSGLSMWLVIDDNGKEWPTPRSVRVSSLPQRVRGRFHASMWPPHARAATAGNASRPGRGGTAGGREQQQPPQPSPPLERCVRLLPGLTESGGFFVAILRKTRPWPPPPPSLLQRAPAAVPEPGGAVPRRKGEGARAAETLLSCCGGQGVAATAAASSAAASAAAAALSSGSAYPVAFASARPYQLAPSAVRALVRRSVGLAMGPEARLWLEPSTAFGAAQRSGAAGGGEEEGAAAAADGGGGGGLAGGGAQSGSADCGGQSLVLVTRSHAWADGVASSRSACVQGGGGGEAMAVDQRGGLAQGGRKEEAEEGGQPGSSRVSIMAIAPELLAHVLRLEGAVQGQGGAYPQPAGEAAAAGRGFAGAVGAGAGGAAGARAGGGRASLRIVRCGFKFGHTARSGVLRLTQAGAEVALLAAGSALPPPAAPPPAPPPPPPVPPAAEAAQAAMAPHAGAGVERNAHGRANPTHRAEALRAASISAAEMVMLLQASLESPRPNTTGGSRAVPGAVALSRLSEQSARTLRALTHGPCILRCEQPRAGAASASAMSSGGRIGGDGGAVIVPAFVCQPAAADRTDAWSVRVALTSEPGLENLPRAFAAYTISRLARAVAAQRRS